MCLDSNHFTAIIHLIFNGTPIVFVVSVLLNGIQHLPTLTFTRQTVKPFTLAS